MVEDYNAFLEKVFYSGAEVTLEFLTDEDLIKNYDTRVEDLEKEYLVLQSPLEKRQPIQVEEGQELTLWCESGQDKQAYVTSVFVIENRKGEVPLLVCCKPQKFEKTSLRRYWRYEVDLDCICTADGINASGRVTDISLGGCCVEVDLISRDSKPDFDDDPEEFTTGSTFHMVVTLPDKLELTFKSQATRILNPSGDAKVGLALRIQEMSVETRENLKHYLFQLQLMS